MNKKPIFAMAVLAALTLAAAPVRAQSDNPEQKIEKKDKKMPKLGSFVRKTVEANTGLNVSDEVYITYEEGNRGTAMRETMDIEFVNCTGNPATGKVWVTLRVRVKDGEKAFVKLDNGTTSDGKIFESGKSLPTEFPAAKNQWVEVVLDDSPLEVPTDLNGFETMKFVSKYGQLFWLHNVKITWVAPEH